jgi:ubiquinone/menaquinone biosynthesis C-methylase UbiE
MPEPKDTFIPALRFKRLTPLFDPVVAAMTRERTFKRRVLDRARLGGADEILDLACGTGTLAIAAARLAPGARVVGVDADPVVLAKARTKARRGGLDISFDEAMSTELPYEDGSFDIVLSTLFFHHLQDDAKTGSAAEVVRILRPRGRLIVGDVGRPQDPVMRLAVLATVQLLDGFATTASNVAGRLPAVLRDAGLRDIDVTDRMRTPTGTVKVITATRGEDLATGPPRDHPVVAK